MFGKDVVGIFGLVAARNGNLRTGAGGVDCAGVIFDAVVQVDQAAVERLDQIKIVQTAVEDEDAAVGGLHRAVIAALTAAAAAAVMVSIEEMHRAAGAGFDQAVARAA